MYLLLHISFYKPKRGSHVHGKQTLLIYTGQLLESPQTEQRGQPRSGHTEKPHFFLPSSTCWEDPYQKWGRIWLLRATEKLTNHFWFPHLLCGQTLDKYWLPPSPAAAAWKLRLHTLIPSLKEFSLFGDTFGCAPNATLRCCPLSERNQAGWAESVNPWCCCLPHKPCSAHKEILTRTS